MRSTQAKFLPLLILLLTTCSVPELSEPTTSVPTLCPVEPPSTPRGSPVLRLEWSEELPMDWRAEQSLVDQRAAYFSNFGLTRGGLREATPIIAALDLNTRKLLWRIEQTPLIPMTTDGERLFALTDRGIVAISTTDGSTLWQATVTVDKRAGSASEMLAGDGWLFYNAGTDTGELYALDAQSGAIVWTNSLGVRTDRFKPVGGPLYWDKYRAMAYDRGRVYIRVITDLSGGKEFRFALVCLDAWNGHRRWDFPFAVPATRGDAPPGAASSPAFSEQAVYFGTHAGISYALQQDTGEVLWQRGTSTDYSPVYVTGQIVSISGYQTVASLDAMTGDLKWAVPFADSGIGMLSPLVFLDNYLVFYSGEPDTGQLSVVDLYSGKVAFTLRPDFPANCSPLFPVAFAAYGEYVYLVTMNCIHAFRVSWGR
jgi:outer membrane protein assembly factor BamB